MALVSYHRHIYIPSLPTDRPRSYLAIYLCGREASANLMMSQSTIIVIGAGVIGLSTATTLQRRYPKYQVVIMAAELPTDGAPTADYASMWAGAHYRPIPRSSRQLNEEGDLAFATAKTMLGIARESPEAGVAVVKSVEYLETVTEEVRGLELKTGDVYAGPEDRFRILEGVELPEGVEWGCEYDSYCVNVPVYCRWLMGRFQAAGGRVVQQRLNYVKDAFSFAEKLRTRNVKCVVNCSGRNFDTDPKMRIIRGQTVLVKQQYDKNVTRQCSDGSWAFLIPRPKGGGTIVGGTKEVGDFETGAREESRRKLLEAAVKHFPKFVKDVDDFVVVKDNVGRRPWREGGLRIEAERLDAGQIVVHGYGAGGRGYELSWGAAERVVDLVGKSIELRPSL